MKTSHEAEDVVQDAYVALWEKREELNPELNIKSFLYTIVHNKCLDCLKHKKTETNYTEIYLAGQTQAVDHQDIDFLEIQSRIHQAIEKLPSACKKIFKLNRLEGLKYREIADKLNISEKAVEKQMGKALRRLRLSLSDINILKQKVG
jgi:RNA polymerase sigma-70 factor (ECF subfamily)